MERLTGHPTRPREKYSLTNGAAWGDLKSNSAHFLNNAITFTFQLMPIIMVFDFHSHFPNSVLAIYLDFVWAYFLCGFLLLLSLFKSVIVCYSSWFCSGTQGMWLLSVFVLLGNNSHLLNTTLGIPMHDQHHYTQNHTVLILYHWKWPYGDQFGSEHGQIHGICSTTGSNDSLGRQRIK